MHRRHGFTLVELGAALMGTTVLVVTAVPVLEQARSYSGLQTSLDNLVQLGIAHTLYAASWDGRQLSNTVYDLSEFGADSQEAFSRYNASGEEHPPLILGWGPNNGALWAYWMDFSGNWGLGQPMVFDGPAFQVEMGWFRVPNAQPLHDYVGGRLYDPTYYAPNDTEVSALVEPLFDEPPAFDPISGSGSIYWSSYCLSPAALFHPDVMRHPDAGGWQNPWDVDHAFATPTMWSVTYADLKTQFIEHHWNQRAPFPRCNSGSPRNYYEGCDPYYFNHGLASAPATVFYDLSARTLSMTEAINADAAVMDQTGSGLWSRDTPLGTDGYTGAITFDAPPTGHHILTTDGIHGRDTIAGAAASPAPMKSKQLEGVSHHVPKR